MSSLKILLVDDDEDYRKIAVRRLESWGYDVISAASGKEAVEVVKEMSPDLVVLDYLMPGMDGIETLKEIRSIDSGVPVIMSTSFPDGRSIVGTEKLGISAYIPKSGVFTDPIVSLKAAIDMACKKAK